MSKSKPSTLEQPEKFLAGARACLGLLRGIPVVAIERLRTDERSRDVIISIIRECYSICDEAGLDLIEEIQKQGLRDTAQESLRELMRDDNPVSLEVLKEKGLKLTFGSNGPIVVPA